MSKSREIIQGAIDTLTASLDDADKFDAGTDAAGTRVRKALQETILAAKDLRRDIQDQRNSRKEARASQGE